MRTTKVLSITLPEPMLELAKQRAKKENRTMSELVREALRRYETTRWLDELKPYAEERAVAAGILTEEQVDRAIHEYRAERRTHKAKATKVRLAS
jgi:Arc/MetJ-type ribon-helix-helix transcriptional regulator